MKASFEINRSDFLGMRELISSDAGRPALAGVHFEVQNNTVFLVGIDGRIMGVLKVQPSVITTDPEGASCEFTVDCPMVKHLPPGNSKNGKKDCITIQYDSDRREVAFSSVGPRIVAKEIETTFPNWRGIIPIGEFVPTKWNFNMDLLEKFRKATQFICPRDRSISLKAQDPEGTSPISVFLHDRRFYGLLMPLAGIVEPVMPDWLGVKKVAV